MEPSTELWSVPRVAAHLDVGKKRVYNLIHEGRLESLRLSLRGIRVFRRSVETYIRERARDERHRRQRMLE
jgi:excisionase family DNA binding protein